MPDSPIVRLDAVDVDIDGRPILHRIMLDIRRDSHLGIVGANGSGKSTLLALIAGLRWPAPGRGRRSYDFGDGPETDAVTARARITLLGPELQDRYCARGWNFRVRDIVRSGFTRSDVPQRHPPASAIEGTEALLAQTGLDALAERRLLSLSRGEQRRVLIARALAFAPALLLLDEPASGLDARARAALELLLAEVAASTPLVVAAHRREDLPAIVGRLVALDRGRLGAEEQGSTEGRPNAVAPCDPAAAPGDSAVAAREDSAEALIVLEQVDVWLDGRRVLDSIDWTIRSGEHWLITGPNGAGKSTLLRLLDAGLRPARGGSIRWPGLGNPSDVWQLRRQVALVSAELGARYRYPTTVAEAIGSGFSASIGATRPLTRHEQDRVASLIEAFELGALADRRLSTLSYGQRQRTLIARTLATGPRILLLDEPWEGIDAGSAATIRAALATCAAAGTQYICVSHVGPGGLPLNRTLRLDGGRRLNADDSSGPRESSASARHRAAGCRQG